jgi:hypothetical protein
MSEAERCDNAFSPRERIAQLFKSSKNNNLAGRVPVFVHLRFAAEKSPLNIT